MKDIEQQQIFVEYAWLIQMGLIETVEILCLFRHVSDMEYAMSMGDGYEEK